MMAPYFTFFPHSSEDSITIDIARPEPIFHSITYLFYRKSETSINKKACVISPLFSQIWHKLSVQKNHFSNIFDYLEKRATINT